MMHTIMLPKVVTSTPGGVQSIAMSMFVCLSAHMSQTSQNFLYMLPMAVAYSSSDDNAIRYVFPVLWMTSCLPIIGEMKATLVRCILKLNH